MSKALILQCPGVVSGSGHRKLENYYGIEFTRGASNGGGVNGYHRMIGNSELLEELPIFNQIHLASVKNAVEQSTINWEGTDGSDVMLVFPKMYAVLGGSDATYERFIFSDQPFSYDGDEAVEIDSFGEAPDWETIENGLARSIYGATKLPTVSTSRYGYETAARAKNTDTASNFPYCNGTTLDLEVVLGILYVECRTKNFNSVFGNGISCNVACNANTWGITASGIRYSDGTYSGFDYTTWTNIPGHSYTSLTYALQAQHAVYVDDATLDPVKNSDGVTLGGRTGICHIEFDVTIDSKTGVCHLLVPMWRGRTNLFGNIWSHLSGYEALNYKDENGVHNVLWRANSIAEMYNGIGKSETNASESGFSFTTDGTYTKVGDLGTTSAWMKSSLFSGARMLATANNPGAAINNYECAFTYVQSEELTTG